MALHDFDKAYAVHGTLLSMLLAEPGGRSNPSALATIQHLCEAAVDAINDVEARVAIRGFFSLATLLYSDEGHADVQMGALRGADAVWFQMRNALSTFRGRLDALERRLPSRPEQPVLAARKGLRVLVVEDNRESADMLAKLLELCGYNVSIAYTALDGLETAQQAKPDVILCDIGLPDSDGFALAQALHANPTTAAARLIAVTAYGEQRDRERSKLVGFAKHLVKPVNPRDLLDLLEQTPVSG